MAESGDPGGLSSGGVSPSPRGYWAEYQRPGFDLGAFGIGLQVLDVGCGSGRHLSALRAVGSAPVGVDIDMAALVRSAEIGPVACAVAEALPFADASFDGVICSVVLPYVEERRALAEVARVLRPGGLLRLSSHGSGYFLRLLLRGTTLGRRRYAAGVLLHTTWYRVTGRRLSPRVSDGVFQSRHRLTRAYALAGLRLVEHVPSPSFLGRPVFIYEVAERST